MNNPAAMLGKEVRHISNPAKIGYVTGISIRGSGTQLAVTWDDLIERWHAIHELLPPPKAKQIRGFQP